MTAATLPLQLLLLTVSGWVHRHQQDVIAYLVEENRVLKEQLGGRKLRLTDDQRRRLAAKARLLGRRALDAVATLVTPVRVFVHGSDAYGAVGETHRRHRAVEFRKFLGRPFVWTPVLLLIPFRFHLAVDTLSSAAQPARDGQ